MSLLLKPGWSGHLARAFAVKYSPSIFKDYLECLKNKDPNFPTELSHDQYRWMMKAIDKDGKLHLKPVEHQADYWEELRKIVPERPW